jgi:hypothetical protein
MIENKENDLLLTMLENPNFGIEEMMVAGLDINNTSLNTREAYKQKEEIQNKFRTDSGEFDEEGYNKKYDEATRGYNIMASVTIDQILDHMI